LKNDINSSEYLHKICGVEFSPAPYFELEEEYQLQQILKQLIKEQTIRSAHDVSEGGIFITLLEAGFHKELGFSITTPDAFRKDAFLFGEAQSRVVVSVAASKAEAFKNLLGNFPATEIGVVTVGDVHVDRAFWGDIREWKEKYDTAIERLLSKEESAGALSMI